MIAARCTDCAQSFLRKEDEDWKRRCFRCWLASKRAAETRPVAAPHVEQVHDELVANLPALVQLCHPDRHAGSAAATRITQWLLAIRRQVRADQSEVAA